MFDNLPVIFNYFQVQDSSALLVPLYLLCSHESRIIRRRDIHSFGNQLFKLVLLEGIHLGDQVFECSIYLGVGHIYPCDVTGEERINIYICVLDQVYIKVEHRWRQRIMLLNANELPYKSYSRVSCSISYYTYNQSFSIPWGNIMESIFIHHEIEHILFKGKLRQLLVSFFCWSQSCSTLIVGHILW